MTEGGAGSMLPPLAVDQVAQEGKCREGPSKSVHSKNQPHGSGSASARRSASHGRRDISAERIYLKSLADSIQTARNQAMRSIGRLESVEKSLSGAAQAFSSSTSLNSDRKVLGSNTHVSKPAWQEKKATWQHKSLDERSQGNGRVETTSSQTPASTSGVHSAQRPSGSTCSKSADVSRKQHQQAQTSHSQQVQSRISRAPQRRKASTAPAKTNQQASSQNNFNRQYQTMLSQMQQSLQFKKDEEEKRQRLLKRRRIILQKKAGVQKVESKFFSAAEAASSHAQETKQAVLEAIRLEKEKEEEQKKEQKLRVAEMNEKLLAKSTQYLQQLESKKKEEAQKEAKLQRKAEMMRKKVREVVFNLFSNTRKKSESGDESSDDDDEADQASAPPKPKSEKKTKFSSYDEAVAAFNQKHGLEPGTKIFTSSYAAIKEALIERGWFENPDMEDPVVYDFRASLKTGDIDFKNLRKDQIVNHYQKNSCVTTKVGLMRSLMTLRWFEEVEADTFFPRCYDLNDLDELEDFLEDFKRTAAVSLLVKFSSNGGNFDCLTDPAGKVMSQDEAETAVRLSLLVIERWLHNSDLECIDERLVTESDLTKEEWAVILAEDPPKVLKPHYIPKGMEKQTAALAPKQVGKLRKEITGLEISDLKGRVLSVLQRFKEAHTQVEIDGTANAWIIKPAGKSRGRGITCVRSIASLVKHIGLGTAGASSHWVVQKYIERPLTIPGSRKFDIRQWVVVTDWNPLTIWCYKECYLRLCMNEFNLHDLENPFSHLSNNAIQKDAEDYETKIEDTMWSHAQFSEWIDANHGPGTWENQLLPAIHQVIIWGLLAAQHTIESRKNSWELFGYDLMLDEDLKPWLIEINASPSMESSTKITSRLCPAALKDIVKLVVDSGDHTYGRVAQPVSPEDDTENGDQVQSAADTGGWECIFRGELEVAASMSALSEKFLCRGDAMPIHRTQGGHVIGSRRSLNKVEIGIGSPTKDKDTKSTAKTDKSDKGGKPGTSDKSDKGGKSGKGNKG